MPLWTSPAAASGSPVQRQQSEFPLRRRVWWPPRRFLFSSINAFSGLSPTLLTRVSARSVRLWAHARRQADPPRPATRGDDDDADMIVANVKSVFASWSSPSHSLNATSGLPFSTMYVASSAALALPTFFTWWGVPFGMNSTSPALSVTGGLPSSRYSRAPSIT